MEPFAFASLAHIQILLVPVGNIRNATFEKWASDVRSFEAIRLGDIPADTKNERARFLPSPFTSGHIHIRYPSHPPSSSHTPLSLFRPSDFPLGIVGIASSSHGDSLKSTLTDFNATVSRLAPHGSLFPLARNCLVFEESDSHTNLDVGDAFPGLVVIPNMMGHKKIYIGTLLADLCSNILAEFATLMQSLESPLGNEYLNAAMFPVLPPLSDMPRSLDNDPHSRDSLPPLPSHNSQPDLANNNTILRVKTPLGLKRSSTASPGLPQTQHRHTSLPTPAMVAKKRQIAIGAASSHGRMFKVLGDLFLLAGRLEDATIWYNEAIVLLKNPLDMVWYASALEGLATIPALQAWGSPGTISDLPGDKEPWSDILDKLTQATAFYFKSAPISEPEATYPLLAYLYTRCVLRQASLLFCVWSFKGWGLPALGAMLQPGSHTLSSLSSDSEGARPEQRLAFSDLERLTVVTGISRAQIASILVQLHGPWLLHLGARERIALLEAIAAMFGALGYRRKEAYILREVLGCVMDLLVCGRDEATGQRMTSAGLDPREKSEIATAQGTVGIRENESTEGNESILRIVKHVCKVHGVNLDAVKLIGSDQSLVPDSTISEDSNIADLEDISALQDPFGWPELQIGIIREAIAVAEALPDYPSVAQFSLSSLKTLHTVMSQSDQHHLYDTAARALVTSKRRGDTRAVEYWSGQPIVSIEVSPLPVIRLPVEKPMSLLSQDRPKADIILTGITDPFLYNPRRQVSGHGHTILVENEITEIMVTLRNPFVFDLELQSLSLSTSGVPFESKEVSVTVPANSYHVVSLTGKAMRPGTLTVRGCIVQAYGGIAREFVLPLATDEEEEKLSRRRSALECETGRSKHAGLDSRPWRKASKRTSVQNSTSNTQSKRNSIRLLECKVVPEQPLLRIRRTSLTHGAVMLYNGETSTIRITLENVSSLPVDFIHLTFDDSTIAPAQQALTEGEMSVFETYETEYDLINRPVFTRDESREKYDVGPGEKAVVTVKCFGKVGCTSGTIVVSYSYIHRRQSSLQEPPDTFHTRQLSYPVLVTVYHMLECHAMDILSYSDSYTLTNPDLLTDDESAESRARRSLLDVGDAADWCLFSIEVRNTYGSPFEVSFDRNQQDVESVSMSCLVPPGSTSRLIIPIKKLTLSEEHVSRPIPTLSDRQFVVTKSKLSAAEERTQRELFWYREELFKCISGRWKESGGSRTGHLSLREQRLSLPMLEALRLETVRVRMSLVRHADDTSDEEIEVNRSGDKFFPKPNEFVLLKTRVTNLSASELLLTLDMTMDPAQHVIYEGISSNIPIGRLGSGETYETECPIAFVSCGQFELFADIQSIGDTLEYSKVGWGRMRVIVLPDNS